MDVYGEARALGTALWDAGHPEWARRIDDAVSEGFTASEILMHVRMILKQVEQTGDLPKELRKRAGGLAREVDRLLS
jgi:hypothetical protein